MTFPLILRGIFFMSIFARCQVFRLIPRTIVLPEITHNPIIQLIDSLVRARIVKTFLESNPSLKIFSWLRMNKIGRNGVAMFQTGLTGAPWKILPAVVNFGKIGKFWESAAKLVGHRDL